jgi:hypothetical protein
VLAHSLSLNRTRWDLNSDYSDGLPPITFQELDSRCFDVRDFVPKDHVSRFIVGLVRGSLEPAPEICTGR